MNTMLDRAIAHLAAHRGQTFTLSDLRRVAKVAVRSQYRLSEQLKADHRVYDAGGNTFAIRAGVVVVTDKERAEMLKLGRKVHLLQATRKEALRYSELSRSARRAREQDEQATVAAYVAEGLGEV